MSLLQRWQVLADLGRRDLVLARLVEGHLDAVTILTGADRAAEAGAMYGVWASASGGTGLHAESDGSGWRITGRMRFCTGAEWLDRALVTARTSAGELLLLDVDVQRDGWRVVPGTWPAVGMDLSDSLDVEVDAQVPGGALVGTAGYYLQRPGFALGGIGVAAVWLGGAAGVLDTITDGLRAGTPDPHQLAHLGAMSSALWAGDAVLARTARDLDAVPEAHLPQVALAARAAVEAAVQVVLSRAPRLSGPTPLCRDADFAHRIADLQVYVRQQHGERDLAALGSAVLQTAAFGHTDGAEQ